MHATLFLELRFWLLVAFSVVVPGAIYGVLLRTRTISRFVVLAFGLTLVGLAGLDVYLLKSLERLAAATPSALDDVAFASEVSAGLYLLPILFAGIGVNMVSHVLISHLDAAERRFEAERPDRRPDPRERAD